MNSHRRVRINPENNTNISILSWFKNCISFFIIFLCFIWKIVKVLWYWTERIILVTLMLSLTIGLAWWLSQKPSLYRDWDDTDAVLPTISWSGNLVSIKNIRNHVWSSDVDFIPSYYDDTFDLSEIEKVNYIITPFSDKDGPAHTMLSFSFSGGKNLVISAELRKERGETFDALK